MNPSLAWIFSARVDLLLGFAAFNALIAVIIFVKAVRDAQWFTSETRKELEEEREP